MQNVTIPCCFQELLPFLSVFYNFFCHPSPPTILPSSLTSSSHLFLGLRLKLVVPKFIYNTLSGILFSSILCRCPNQRIPSIAAVFFSYSFFTAFISTSVISHTICFHLVTSIYTVKLVCRNNFVTYLCTLCICCLCNKSIKKKTNVIYLTLLFLL